MLSVDQAVVDATCHYGNSDCNNSLITVGEVARSPVGLPQQFGSEVRQSMSDVRTEVIRPSQKSVRCVYA